VVFLVVDLRGEPLFVGDNGCSTIIAVSSGSKISDGSTFAGTALFRVRVVLLGVLGMDWVVFRRDCVVRRGLRCGAGVNSSSSLSSNLTLLV
jgi:hypothetical protein